MAGTGYDIVFDFQSFKDKHDKFLPKEVAVGAVHKLRHRALWIVAPPYDISELPPQVRAENDWLTANYHGLQWSQDGITIEELCDELEKTVEGVGDDAILYARGHDAVKFLEEATGRKIQNLGNNEDLPLRIDPSPPTTVCSWHHQHFSGKNVIYNCALENVKKLQYYLSPYAHSLEQYWKMYK